jgi:hypothetical protein
MGLAGMRPGRIAEIFDELADAGFRRHTPLVDEEAQRIERARLGCRTCTRGDASSEALAQHNLRCSELGERSYPCTQAER